MSLLLGLVTNNIDPEKRGRIKAVIPGFAGETGEVGSETTWIERITLPGHHFVPNGGEVVAIVMAPRGMGAVQMFYLGVDMTTVTGNNPSPRATDTEDPQTYRNLHIIDFDCAEILGDLNNSFLEMAHKFGTAKVQVDCASDQVNVEGTKINLGTGGASSRGGF
jgi:hypothetical protein